MYRVPVDGVVLLAIGKSHERHKTSHVFFDPSRSRNSAAGLDSTAAGATTR